MKIDGFHEAVALLAGLDETHRAKLLVDIQKRDPALFERLNQGLFRFESILELEPKDLVQVIRQVPTDLVILALRGLEPNDLNRFLAGFSKRQGEEIRKAMLEQGPRKMSDIQAARLKIVEVALKLAEAKVIQFRP